jgi:hypothetical protein
MTRKTMKHPDESDRRFTELATGLMAGDFSRVAPLFQALPDGSANPIIRWYENGSFSTEPKALAEALSCACFNGITRWSSIS